MITRPDMPIDNRTREEWASRYAVELVDWYFQCHSPQEFDAFEDGQWNLQVEIENGLARLAIA